MIVVCEDLHWSDHETQAVLDRLVGGLTEVPLLLLVTSRPEYLQAWGGQAAYTALRLEPLPHVHTAVLLEDWLGTDATLPPLTSRLIERTQGNPFFLEESVHILLATGVLVGSPGAYALAQPVDRLQVPATVQIVLAARIDRLPPEEKTLLQTAAVIGHEVPFLLLQAMSEVPKATLDRRLAYLRAVEFLYETGLFPERAFRFKHALTHEVAYGSLHQERRRTLHARIVEVLERSSAGRPVEQVDRLAHHALGGEVWDKAVTYSQQAGARTYDRSAFREAVASFGQALQALAHLPEPGDTRGLALELRLAMGRSLAALGEYGRHLALLGEAEALARALDDWARLGRVLAQMARLLRQMGDPDGAMAAGRQANALAAALGDSALQGEASLNLGQTSYAIGDFGRAAELLRRNVEAADRESDRPSTDVRIQSRAWLARTLGHLGAFTEGQRHGEEALRLATLEGRGQTPIIAYGCLGNLYLAKGDLEHAIRVLDQGLALCRASGNRSWFRAIAASLGYASALQGRLAEGHVLLEEAISESTRTGAVQNQAYWVAWLSEVCRLAGRGEEAWQRARQALDLARQYNERANEVLALHQLGAVHAHADPLAAQKVEAHYQQALALAQALGMRPLQAHCHLGLGTLYTKIGRPEQARAELSAAIDLYRAMEMTFWLPQAEAELAEVK